MLVTALRRPIICARDAHRRIQAPRHPLLPAIPLAIPTCCMTIVTSRYRRKRPAVPRIVQLTPRGRAWKPPPPDPEAEARAAAFFERMGTKRREGT